MRTLLINLPHRTDRLERSKKELHGFDIEVEKADFKSMGAEGLWLTMRRIFESNNSDLMIFEDDVKLLHKFDKNDLNRYIRALPKDAKLLYLGGLLRQQTWPINDKFAGVISSYSSHAIYYPKSTVFAIRELLSQDFTMPYDVMLNKFIKQGKYITKPLIASQYPCYSDIEEKKVDWDGYIQSAYKKYVI